MGGGSFHSNIQLPSPVQRGEGGVTKRRKCNTQRKLGYLKAVGKTGP